MAIYHLSVKPISRSSGRSATGAAAYRAGKKITDERTGEIHDYTRKKGVESADIVLPKNAPVWAEDRAKLWNAAELAEIRKNACVAREFEVALPHELPAQERRKLAIEFAQDMANREGCAVDVAIHAPSDKHDNLNYHAHILRTTRKIEADGLGEKLDTEKAGRNRKNDLEAVRARWADMTNAALERNGIAARVDHRTLNAQGVDRAPTKHLGPAATGYERRTGLPSDNRMRQEATALASPREPDELEQVNRSIASLSGDLEAAKAERDSLTEVIATGMSDFKARYAAHKAEREARAAAELQAAQQAKEAEAQQKAAQQAKEAADAVRAQAEAEEAANERRAAQIEAFRLSRGRDVNR